MSVLDPVEDFYYRPNRGGKSFAQGSWKGLHTGIGKPFKGLCDLIDYPDPRRIDVHASILNPTKQLKVRVPSALSRISVNCLIDVSASMTTSKKKEIVYKFLRATARSTKIYGDSLGVYMFGDLLKHKKEWVANSATKNMIPEIISEISKISKDTNSEALKTCHHVLPAKGSIIFLLSDFMFDLDNLNIFLKHMSDNLVIPVWVGQDELPPPWVFANIWDPERARRHSVFVTPGLLESLTTQRETLLRQLAQVCHKHGIAYMPLESFSSSAITSWFASRGLLS